MNKPYAACFTFNTFHAGGSFSVEKLKFDKSFFFLSLSQNLIQEASIWAKNQFWKQHFVKKISLTSPQIWRWSVLQAPIFHTQTIIEYPMLFPQGVVVLALTWYTYMCLPIRVLFHKIWYNDRWVFIRGEEAHFHKVGAFWAIIVKTTNLGKIGCFFYQQMVYWLVDNCSKRKVKFLRSSRFIHVQFLIK